MPRFRASGDGKMTYRISIVLTTNSFIKYSINGRVICEERLPFTVTSPSNMSRKMTVKIVKFM